MAATQPAQVSTSLPMPPAALGRAPLKGIPPVLPFVDRFGLRFTLYSWGTYDSNILRRVEPERDLSGVAYPTISIEYPFSFSTRLTANYQVGFERFDTASFLSSNSHWGELRLTHQLSPTWEVQLYDSFEKTNQLEPLTNVGPVDILSYTQNRAGLRLEKRFGHSVEASFEYASHQRLYSEVAGATERRRDLLNAWSLGLSKRYGANSFFAVRAEYRLNNASNAVYRYREAFGSVYFNRNLGRGYRVELYERLSALSFPTRFISKSPAQYRSDLIVTTSIGLRKPLFNGPAIIVRYAYQRDFSNDPAYHFTDHRVTLGFEVSLWKPSVVPSPVDAARSPRTDRAAAELGDRGYQELLAGSNTEALRYSQKALEIDPGLAQAHVNAGIACYRLGMLDKAIDHWRRSLSIQPGNKKVRELLRKAEDEQQQSRQPE